MALGPFSEVATLTKRERGYALNLSVEGCVPPFVSLEPADESTKPREPTPIGRLTRH